MTLALIGQFGFYVGKIIKTNEKTRSLSFQDVCALRLDFETFTTSRGTTAAPTEDNTCGDVFTITVKSYSHYF